MSLSSRRVFSLLIAVCVITSACDQVPGPASDAGEPPRLSEFSFAPHEFAVPHDAEGEELTVSLTMEVTPIDPDDDLETVAFVVQSPSSSQAPVAEGILSPTEGGTFEGTSDLTISSGAIGVYTVLVYAVDAAGAISNQVRGMLRIRGVGRPPVIEDVEADPEVVRPPTTLTLIAIVSDPDGLENIARVEGTTPNGNVFQMFDDGETLGDEVASDGRYTARFDVDAATPGTQTFTFKAVDRSGLESEVFSKDIVVE